MSSTTTEWKFPVNNWVQTSTSATGLQGIAFGNEVFVAVSNNGARVLRSTDGQNWSIITNNIPQANSWRAITYGNGLFVAISSDGGHYSDSQNDINNFSNQIITSPDGENWTQQRCPKNNAYSYGITDWRNLAYGNGLFVAIANGGKEKQLMTSSNAITWTLQTINKHEWTDVTYGNGIFVAVTHNPTAYYSPNEINIRVMTSTDGINWTRRNGPIAEWRCVTFGNGLFVAVTSENGPDLVMTSSDGINWTRRSTLKAQGFQSITYGEGLFIAVSNSGNIRTIISPDGINWIGVTSYGPDVLSYSKLYGIDYDSQKNTDLNNIRTPSVLFKSPGNYPWMGIAFGNKKYVAVGGSGTSVTSKYLLPTTLTQFNIPNKTAQDSSFQITSPISDRSGVFNYSSSNTAVATISGDIITIKGSGTSNITATQLATNDYDLATITTLFSVKSAPTITEFNLPIKNPDDSPFTITPPQSNSTGLFSYSSSNTSVATIDRDIITIIDSGDSIITVFQSETADYTSGTITAALFVATVITSSNILSFMNSSSTYCYITEDIELNTLLKSANKKIITNNNKEHKIKKS